MVSLSIYLTSQAWYSVFIRLFSESVSLEHSLWGEKLHYHTSSLDYVCWHVSSELYLESWVESLEFFKLFPAYLAAM